MPQKSLSESSNNSTEALYEADESLVELIEVLENIDENKVAAELNEVSMIDSKGGRIYY